MKRLLIVAFLFACAEPTAPPDVPLLRQIADGSGQVYFEESCASCHAARDGFDLAYFSYSDTNIVRRALGHVDSTKSWAIATYIASLSTPHVAEATKLFQPGGVVLAGGVGTGGDTTFAKNLFGVNAWPDTLTRGYLLTIRPDTIKVALDLLLWSRETACYSYTNCNLEWMPRDSLPPAVLAWNGNAGANALGAYYANRTSGNLDAVILAVEAALTNTASGVASCNVNSTQKKLSVCFEARRWVSSLAAVHLLQVGPISDLAYFEWWEVGTAARLSKNLTGVNYIENYFQHWSRWMYLGWMNDPDGQPCVYTADGQIFQSLKRHGVFICLRSLAARAPGEFSEDLSPYKDFQKLSNVTPSGTNWAFNAGKFALEELLRRLNLGDRPPTPAERTTATNQVNTAMNQLMPKVSAAELLILNALADQVRAALAAP